MNSVDQLRYLMLSYETRMNGHISDLETVESELSAVASHSSHCQVLQEAYSDLEDTVISNSFSHPTNVLNRDIAMIESLRNSL